MADRAVAIAAGAGTGLVAVASSAVEAEPVGLVAASLAVGRRVRRAVAAPVAGRASAGSGLAVHRAFVVAGRAKRAEQSPGPGWRAQCV